MVAGAVIAIVCWCSMDKTGAYNAPAPVRDENYGVLATVGTGWQVGLNMLVNQVNIQQCSASENI